MKTTSTDFKTLAENPYGARYHPKITVNGVEITDDINDFNYTGMCNAGDKFSIGNTCSAMVTFYIDNPSVNLSGKEIEVSQGINVNGTMEYVKLGKFKVLKPSDIRGRVSYQCVDRMTYLMDMPYFSQLSVPTTDVKILQEICSQVGISLTNTNLTSHTMNAIPSGYTRREVISYMAQFQGKNAIINDDGNLELIWYKESGYTVDDNKIYFDGTADINDETDYTLGYIECTVRSADGASETTLKSGTGTTGIRISNPFMTQEILDEVFSVIGGFSFRSCTFEFLGDFRLEVGDIVTVNTNGKTYKVPIMQLDQSSDGGVVTTITSIAETDSENELDITGPFTIAMDRYYAELVLINQAMINKLTVEQADIRYLQTDKLDAIEADIENAVIDTVSANYATIKQLNALTLVVSGKLEASELNAKVAELGYVTADTVSAKYATIEKLNALDLTVQGKLSASEADLRYADITLGNIDMANINVANIGLLFAKVGLIDRATIVDGHITGYLDAVEINANSITAGTLIADRLLLKGSENGLLYALNNLGEVTSTAVDTLDGNIITQRTVTADKLVAKSITADELDVTNIFGNSAVLTTLTSQAAFINAISTNSIVVGASNNATEALETANTANTNASSAIDTANSANSTANAASSNASSAMEAANNALTGANSSVKLITMHYLATSDSSGVTTSTEGWTTTKQDISVTKKYLWTYQTMTTVSGETSDTTPVISGVYGDKGNKGDAGTSVTISSTSVTYQASSSGTTTPTGTWSTTVPTVSNGQYLWTKTIVNYSDGKSTTSYSVAYKGTNGKDGTDGTDGSDGRGIKSTSTTYQTSTSGTTVPTGTWSSSIPSVSAGSYLWTRTIVTYTDSTTSTSYSVGMMGATGDTGTGVSKVTPLYYLKSNTTVPSAPTSAVTSTSTSSGVWTTAIPTYVSGYTYFTCTQTLYTDGIYKWSTVVIDNGLTNANSNAYTANSNANSALSTANSANNKATYHYGTCGTAAATVAKVVTLSGFTLYTGATISVKFTYANTAASPTLNVNGTGAKAIYVYGSALTASSAYNWVAGSTVQFTYNGSQWVMTDTSAMRAMANWCYNNNITEINGASIAAGTITAEKINANTLSAITADLGTVTAGTIKSADELMTIDLNSGIISSKDSKESEMFVSGIEYSGYTITGNTISWQVMSSFVTGICETNISNGLIKLNNTYYKPDGIKVKDEEILSFNGGSIYTPKLNTKKIYCNGDIVSNSIKASAISTASGITLVGLKNTVDNINSNLSDTGWVLLAGSTSNGYIYYRKKNGYVTVKANGSSVYVTTAGSYKTLATLPSGCRPSIQIDIPCVWLSSNTAQVNLRIDTSGVIAVWSTISSGYWTTTVTFPV